MYYWDEMTHSPHHDIKSGFTNLMTLLSFVSPLTAIWLVCEGLENALDFFCCGKYLHAPALLPIVLTQ